jgi:hypothetical protein
LREPVAEDARASEKLADNTFKIDARGRQDSSQLTWDGLQKVRNGQYLGRNEKTLSYNALNRFDFPSGGEMPDLPGAAY